MSDWAAKRAGVTTYWRVKNHLCLIFVFFSLFLCLPGTCTGSQCSYYLDLNPNEWPTGVSEKDRHTVNEMRLEKKRVAYRVLEKKWLNPDASCKLIWTRIPQLELNASMKKKKKYYGAPLNASWVWEKKPLLGKNALKQHMQKQ